MKAKEGRCRRGEIGRKTWWKSEEVRKREEEEDCFGSVKAGEKAAISTWLDGPSR